MSLVILHHDRLLTLASTSRVVAADQTGALDSALENARSLSQLLSEEQDRISQAESQARTQGYAAGQEAGRQEALNAAAHELTAERQALAAMREQLQQQAVRMAFDIVRKLADTLEPARLLAALAETAATFCDPQETLTLKVHEDHRQAVEQQLANSIGSQANRFSRVVGVAGVPAGTCIIETSGSRIVADLDVQAAELEARLADA